MVLFAVHARTVNERLLPVREVDVAEHAALDFRLARRIGPAELNHAWTALEPGPDGRTRVRVLDDTGRGAELVADARCRWLQVYTADHQDGDAWRGGLAVEPMTCPPDALRSGRDLVGLEPGRPWTTGWTIRAVGTG